MIRFLNRIVSFAFYALFFLIPLVFTSDTSELFEFNKMWLTFGLAIVIGFCWVSKIILERQIRIRRTPLDIPILLFLTSQLVATVVSLDTHVSWLGYYSRFNGGMLSLLTYAFLYFAFVSLVELRYINRYIVTIVIGGIIVALWGLPAHFGYDPTCFVFRGTFDVSCWTFAFQPKVRIFSTLGQPDWLAAYLDALIPVTMYLAFQTLQKKKYVLTTIFCLTVILFYIDLLFSSSKAAYLGFIGEMAIIITIYIWLHRHIWKDTLVKKNHFLTGGIVFILLLFTFFMGTPITQLNRFTFPTLQSQFASTAQQMEKHTVSQTTTPQPVQELGGTDSGTIRLLVWKGAIDAWLAHPVFGTGVETFAFAYYLYRPAAHNMTSEWDYLYNKAHNEYLNYLATTGSVGLGTYLFMIGVFLFIAVKKLMEKPLTSVNQLQNLFVIMMLASYFSILFTNFFGFSVVIMNIFLFLFPAFVFMKQDVITQNRVVMFPQTTEKKEPSGFQWLGVTVTGLICCYLIFVLFAFWNADKSYALGQNLDHVGQYQQAYQSLHAAVTAFPNEPTFQDELALNDAALAAAVVTTNATAAGQLASEAIQTSNVLVTQHPNNVTYWKDRVRILYTLGQLNPAYDQEAIIAIQKSASLAPTDAKVFYNYGLIEGQAGNTQNAINILQRTIQLKPDYKEAYYALGLYYRQIAVDKTGKVVHQDMEQNAIATMQYILNHFSQTDAQALAALKAWGVQR